MKAIMAIMAEKYGNEILKAFHEQVQEKYGDDYVVPQVGEIDLEVMMDELFCYLSGSMEEVFDEIDKDGMIGEGLDLEEL